MLTQAARLFAILFTLFHLAGPARADDGPAPQPISKGERCPVCGMYPANYPKWHAQVVFKDGSHASFDSAADMFRFLHDMARYDKKHQSKDVARIYVPSFSRGDWLDARQARFVAGSRVNGPMGADLPAFASAAEAAEFAKKNGGKVLEFGQVTPGAIDGGGESSSGHGGHNH